MKSDISQTQVSHFRCPKCGGGELMVIRRAMLRAVATELVCDAEGRLHPRHLSDLSPLSGEVMGYRCAACRWPDVNSSAATCAWKTLDDVQLSGALTLPRGAHRSTHRCMVCEPSGSMNPLLLELSGSPALTPALRRRVLQLVGAPAGSLLLAQSDSGIRSFACRAWKQVPHLALGTPPSPHRGSSHSDG